MTPQRYWLVLLLFLHTVNTYMDRICISTAKDAMQDDISGLTDQRMGYAFGIFAIGYALFQIPAGWYSDRAGPRKALTIVVIIWSIFTALTGAVYTAISLLVVRFLFGVGEAGAYPGATRALYTWLPAKERGLGQGVFHSGARIGAAVSLVVMPMVIGAIGWRSTFFLNAIIGVVWAGVWWFWYRDNPADHQSVGSAELKLIKVGIAEDDAPDNTAIPYVQVVTSSNVLLAMFQYASSNITFFISMTWLRPYIVDTWGEDYGWYSSIPLLCGAVALWCSGYLVTSLHRAGCPVISRRLPAMVGYALGAIGLLMCTQTVESESVWPFIICFSIAMFGVEMTLSPSWAFCMDIGGSRSGAVSAAMNMVGNLGAAVSAVAFPYFVANITMPVFAENVGTANSFFVFAAGMNLLAVFAWTMMNPLRELKLVSRQALKIRLAFFAVLIVGVISALIYTKFIFSASAGKPAEQSPAVESARMTKPLKGVAIGAGYFSQFHFDAWARIENVELTAICDLDREKAEAATANYGVPKCYTDFGEMLTSEKPDFVDIITRPDSHLALVREATSHGVAIICQKPLAPTYEEAKELVALAAQVGVPLMVHENFRFQPWYREIKTLVNEEVIGDKLHSIQVRTRTGDGWQSDAYLARQPYFREMTQFLIFETGVHFIDVFRFLAGEISGVYASLRRLNPVIAGEDSGTVLFEHANGVAGIWDANRFNETNATDPRYTFGEALVEGSGGSIRLYADGRLTVQRLGNPEEEHRYEHAKRNFASDCVLATQNHFVDCLTNSKPFETSGEEYLKTLAVQEAVYTSAETGQPVRGLDSHRP